jgi:hypothetical protein
MIERWEEACRPSGRWLQVPVVATAAASLEVDGFHFQDASGESRRGFRRQSLLPPPSSPLPLQVQFSVSERSKVGWSAPTVSV